MRLSSYALKNLHLDLESLQAWLAILGLVLISAVGVVAGVGKIMSIAFPVCSFAVGLFLFCRYPVLYVGFTLWLWFLTPWLRRLVDFRSGWDERGVILVAPFLVTLITFITFLQYLPRSYRQGGLPFILAFAGVFYGFLIGLVNNSPLSVARAFLDWLTPVLFGFHLFVNWRNYPKFRQNIQRTFLWGVLVTGVYGVVQYLVAPEWDRLWIIQTELTTNGTPEPLGIRVFSTMNSPAPFAVVMMAGLLLLLNNGHLALRIPASVAGYAAFLLSSVRSAWGGWFVGLLTLFASLKTRLQMRLIITIIVMVTCVLPLATIEPFSEVISSRFETFSNLEEDVSFNARLRNYDRNLNTALSSSLGYGIGTSYFLNKKDALQVVGFDSGILDAFFTLGWLGAIPYLGGLILLVFELFQGSECRFDSFASAARAIVVGTFAQLALGSVMLGISGMVLWGFLGISMAAHKYYQHQRSVRAR